MKNLLLTGLAALLVLTFSCTPKTGGKTIAGDTSVSAPAEPSETWDTLRKPLVTEDETPIEYNILDDVEVTPEPEAGWNVDSLKPYNPSHTFQHDLIHTKVDISFDWAKRRANGKATLTLRPWFYPTDQLVLDAKNFDIKSVTFEGKTEQLPYNYDSTQLRIRLGRQFTRTEEFKVVIVYTAKPDERSSYGGSAAITSDKGLYFINHDGADKDKPRQIWTQGETESNSFWMPTIDKPNERCTQEMYITVEDKYKTLSNGLLINSKKNADGTRTDYWRMDKPHAPYLFMMAVGEFAVVKDKWRGIDVDYYVEPKFEKYARDIFPYTPEMLEFFSKKLNYDYPWSKFSQIVVRDYVSGAMENTTAVIFGEYVQKTQRELLDDHLVNEKVVAHEMFHQWFGDLVTTESWANLTLNEGFANYSEFLWMEHKHGREAAEDHELAERQGYLFSAADGGHPLIHFGYNDREQMFDAHSYNKGGAILHMLRTYVGDDAFFAALNRYLKRNEYTEVEADELRMAFEDVTGQDMNWFWNQWFFSAGHPTLDIQYGWDEASKKASVTVKQTQEGADVPRVFDLPLKVDIYDASGKVRREDIRITMRNQTFQFNCPEKPALINFDAEKALLCVKTDQHTPEEWAFMYRHAPLFTDRAEALDALQAPAGEGDAEAKIVFYEALTDKYHGLRQRGLSSADPSNPLVVAAVEKMAASEPDPSTRAFAIGLLSQTGDKKYIPVLQNAISETLPYSVVGAAVNGLSQLDAEAAAKASKVLEADETGAFMPMLADMYANSPSREHLAFFEKNMPKADQMAAFSFFDAYSRLLIGLNDAELLDNAAKTLETIATTPAGNSEWRRFASTKAIADFRNHYREGGNEAKATALQGSLDMIKSKETDETLKLYYDMF
ncbi:MAG: alanyl aminopeptidase [Saprospiraceae bacterium]|nr:alanyl aminopeptidase [Saprospiraceae bacterium]